MANPCDGFGQDKPAAPVRRMIARASEAQMRRRPELWTRWSEQTLVQCERLGILPAIGHLCVGAAGCRVVVQLGLQCLSAPSIPIVARIDEMLMPDLVDDFARGDRCRRHDGKKAKAPIGIDSRASVLKTP